MQSELQTLVARYGGATNLVREIKKIQNPTDSKKAKLEASMDKLLQEYGNISLARFKKEASKAWHRAFPDGLEKRELRGYQLFVKENMAAVKAAHPNKTHAERMAIIGGMWQESKGTPAPSDAAMEEAEADDVEEEIQPEPEPEPAPRRTRSRGRQ